MSFTEDALVAAAPARPSSKKTGARGLRTIIEETLLDVMFDIPSQETVGKCIITRDAIEGKRPPMLITRNDRPYDRDTPTKRGLTSAGGKDDKRETGELEEGARRPYEWEGERAKTKSEAPGGRGIYSNAPCVIWSLKASLYGRR